MGRDKSPDFDFVTPLHPEEVERRLHAAGRRVFGQGGRFGTLGVKVEVNGVFIKVEITTFRREVYTEGSRKPTVTFDVTNITDELSRHDFTMNALAIGPTGKLIDPFGGRAHIAQSSIAAVGHPTHRFKEDPLRMMRAYRFASQLGFLIEERTFSSMKKYAHRILTVSKERQCAELDKLLMGDCSGNALRTMWLGGMMKFIIPELQIQLDFDQHSPYHAAPLHEHTALVVQGAPNELDLKWAALLHDVGKPAARTYKMRGGEWTGQCNFVHHETIGAELVESIGQRLHWSKAQVNARKALVAGHLDPDSPLKPADDAAAKPH
jgi:tRNA nucleotidyltransferase (CCA-adding enzyme)